MSLIRTSWLALAASIALPGGAFAQSAVKVPVLSQEQMESLERARLHGPMFAGRSFIRVPGGWPDQEPGRQVAGRPWWRFGNPPSFMRHAGGNRYQIFNYGAAHPTDPELVCLTSVQEIEVSATEWDYDADPDVFRMYGARFAEETRFFAGCTP